MPFNGYRNAISVIWAFEDVFLKLSLTETLRFFNESICRTDHDCSYGILQL